MIPVRSRSSQHIGVFGLGVSGCASVHALIAGGASVAAWDDSAEVRESATRENILLENPDSATWKKIDALLLSPGVPLTHPSAHPVVKAARRAGKPVIGDIELIMENTSEATFIGVTGTNGKSTTTALIHHVLQKLGLSAQLGGNFGTPALSLQPTDQNGTIILEVSSYQLDLTETATFNIAVLLNITPDHLDRHGNMNNYVAAKRQIFRNANQNEQLAIVGTDDQYGKEIFRQLNNDRNWKVIQISTEHRVENGVYVTDGVVCDTENNCHDLSAIKTLQGRHNWQNAAAAWAVLRALNIEAKKIIPLFETFPGLPHRLEIIGDFSGVLYVNDSKATNGQSAASALSTYSNIFWIAGGIPKEDGLAPTFSFLDRVSAVFLIGEATEQFAAILATRGIACTKSGQLELALRQARKSAIVDTSVSPVILFSPACASFDQYPNFEKRGDHFRNLVITLEGRMDK